MSARMTTQHANLCPPTITVWIHRVLTSDVDRWMPEWRVSIEAACLCVCVHEDLVSCEADSEAW